MKKKVCGPMCSICGIILSIWGFVQLAIMGAFFYVHSVSLVEDIHLSEQEFLNNPEVVDAAYKQQAYNCWVCAGLYLLLLGFSAHQMWINIKPAAYRGI
jgi:ribonuclease kappa